MNFILAFIGIIADLGLIMALVGVFFNRKEKRIMAKLLITLGIFLFILYTSIFTVLYRIFF